ncbi:unnamed protein product [Dicrocoelium dendriticum]|nr:unnamed protein product [Dicrocoelium dendriticum]
MLSKIGRRNGEALIRFTDPEQRELALCRHKHHMGQRYIEVYGAHSQEFIAFATTETSEAEEFLKRFVSPRQTLVRMRGLPYSVNAEQILQFFDNNHCSVQFGSDGILFVNRPDGRASGDAFVMFETNEVAERALKSHRQHIGNRYIELFKSTPAEVNQVLNATVRQEVTCPKRWIGLSGNAESSSNGILPSTVPYIDGVRELLSTYASTVRTEPPCGLANRFSLPSLHAYPTGNNLLGSQNLATGLHHLDSFGSAYMPALVSMYSMLSPQPVLPKAFNAGVFPYACDTFWLNPYSSVPGVQLNTGHQWGRYPQVQKDPSYTIPQRAAPLMEDIVIPTVRDDTFPVMPVGMDQLAKCFIRIRGMPLEADILDILTFVGDAWRSIVVHGVHLVYNSLGRSNGEAIIQFVSEKAAQWMIEQKHGSIFFKRTAQTVTSSFVEVIQCTAEDVTQLMYTVAALVQANIHTAKPLHGELQQMSLFPAIFNPLDIHVNPPALPYLPYHGSEVILNSLGLPGIVTPPCSHMNMQFAARSTHPIGPMYTPGNNRTEVFIGATPPMSIATELPMHDVSVNHMNFIPVQTNTANPPTVLQQPLGAFGQANPALFQQNPLVSGLVLPQPGVNSNVCQPYTTMGYGNSTNASVIQTESQKAELAHPVCESVNQKLLEIKPDSSTDGQSPGIQATEPGLPRIPKQGAPHEKVGQTGRVAF